MAKIALLIGASEYLPEFPALPSAVKDVEAMKEVLGNSEMGGFDNIEVLKNSNRQQIEEAIYDLFADRNKDDVLLFYFSGHGVKSREGNLFLATPQTRKGERGIVTPTAVGASLLQSQMNDSFSQRLVVILDCCYSGAFTKGMTAKGDENIDIQTELGGEGRAILMSSSAVQSSFESEGSELSIYTKYLVEGIKTGAADTDNNGKISADELHQYVSEKVRQESPAMTPQFEPHKEGYRIFLARSPQDEPNLKFRREVKEILIKNNGEISLLDHNFLDELYREIGLSQPESEAIITEEKQPYELFKNKLKRYEDALILAVKESNPLTENNRKTLQKFQSLFGLRDEDIAPIEEKIISQLPKPPNPKPKLKVGCFVIIGTGVLLSISFFTLLPKSAPPPRPLPSLTTTLPTDQNSKYSKLENLLKEKEWKEADIETSRLMLKVAGGEERGYLSEKDVENFPCTDLRTIDQLWVEYSDRKFGFSVQKKIYQSLGGTKEYDSEVWKNFGDQVGWRKGDEWLSYDNWDWGWC
ncbi:caspase, EACC1-associated type [Okeania hirsuta]|uniref:caspase, EACC1-associated type n=1 Tax=Okeania hirsuta TaxID=1458930 RepID=UPI001374ABB2|nr:GUN4 domain-containing protein [Okeania hirsuta]